MIKITEGELLDLLPSQLKNDTDMICLSHALKMAVQRLLDYELGTMTQNFVELLPEHILDVLAVELRSPYYLQSMDIEVKRGIIKNTLVWHTKAGTASAVSEMIDVIFGDGGVVEWPDFDEGEKIPGTFDIITGARMTEGIVEFFMQVIERVKNERSHLRRVLIERDVNVEPKAGSGAIHTPETIITNNKADREESASHTEYAGAGSYSTPETKISNNPGDPKEYSTGFTEHAAARAISIPKIVIINQPGDFPDSFIAASQVPGAGAAVYPNIVITNTKDTQESQIKAKPHSGAGAASYSGIVITNGAEGKEERVDLSAYSGVGSVTNAHLTITNHPRDENEEGEISLQAGTVAASYPRTIIN